MDQRQLHRSRHLNNPGLPRMVLAACIAVALLLGAAFIALVWRTTENRENQNAIGLARAAASFVSTDELALLQGNESDTESSTYWHVKQGLAQFIEANPQVRFAYIMRLKAGQIIFLVDSEPAGSPDLSPPGQVFDEASEQDYLPFSTAEPVMTGSYEDRWGSWVSAMVPIIDSETGQVVAVLGTDYPSSGWRAEILRHTWPFALTAAGVLLLLGSLVLLYRANRLQKKTAADLSMREELFRMVFDQAPVGICVVDQLYLMSIMNDEFVRIIGRTREDLTGRDWMTITHPDDLEANLDLFRQFQEGQIDSFSMDKRYVKPDGSFIWTRLIVVSLEFFSKAAPGMVSRPHLTLLQDIHERKMAEDALVESERSKSTLLSNLPGLAYRCRNDRNWTMEFLSEGCQRLTGYRPESLLHNRDLSFNDVIASEYRDFLWNEWQRLLPLRLPFRNEYEIITASGERRWVLELAQGIYSAAGQAEAIEGIIIDITESREHQNRIRFLSDHDPMTGLFNRRRYDEEKARFEQIGYAPLAVIIADINGLRLVNESCGDEAGDRMILDTAHMMQNFCRDVDILSRTGGDEFRLLMPGVGNDDAVLLLRQIGEACAGLNAGQPDPARHINLAVGFGIRSHSGQPMQEAEREAEEYMHKRKLLEGRSYHSAVLTSVMTTLLARSQETEEHAVRLADLSCALGRRLGLTAKELDDLKLFAMLHDIGKVGIDDRILNKPGRLSDEEWVEMKKHPEIGHRIALTTPGLAGVAEHILTHHERWDGRGYPNGLSGEQIPLLARILSVVDAYDAMTEARVYRAALKRPAALDEIVACAGSQFDPTIARLFIELVGEQAADLTAGGGC